MLAEMETIPEDLRELSCSMVDFYYGNFHYSSLFRIPGPSASFSP